jgi:hypothetical protein
VAVFCLSRWQTERQEGAGFVFVTMRKFGYRRRRDISRLYKRMWPIACWDCGFESRRGYGYLSVVSVVCCKVEVSATGRSLVQRSPTDCDLSLCVIKCNNPSTPDHGYVERGWTKKERYKRLPDSQEQ